jgi:hypothetical protein
MFSTKYDSVILYNDIGDNMKKYILSISIALIAGFFMGKAFLEQYDAYEGIRMTSNDGEILYFLRVGIYESMDLLEKDTISLANYIYNEIDGKYYVYVGITKNSKNLIKISNYFSSLGYHTITEEFLVTNINFLKELKNYDNILDGTDDEIVISSVSNLILSKYEELVINGSKD